MEPGYTGSLILVTLAITLATFTQTVSGFGFGLVSMPLLVALLGIQTAAPLVALAALALEVVILVRYREAFNLQAVRPLIAASLVGIVPGVYLLRQLDERVVTLILGIIIVSYALYALFTPKLPRLEGRGWAYGLGFVGGLLSGAYNTGGPPVIIYGHCRRWAPAEFKSNLQGFFLVAGIFVVITHALSGNYQGQVWSALMWVVPGLIVGLVLGFLLDRYINAALFRRLVLILLIFLGVALII